MSLIDSKFLPSKKFIIAGAVLVSIILVAILLHKVIQNKRNQNALVGVTVGDIIRQDSNNDGIPDWQETLSELKESNPEIQAAINTASSGATDVPRTHTEQFAQDVFVTLSALSQDNLLDVTTADYIGQNMSSFVNKLSTSKTWTAQDLTVVGNSTQALQNYMVKFNLFTQIYNPALDPVTPLQNSIISKDSASLEELAPIAQHNADALESLQSEPIPEQALEYHLAIMNSIQGIKDSVEGMEQYFVDPLLTFSAILLYNDSITNYFNATENINNNVIYPLAERQ